MGRITRWHFIVSTLILVVVLLYSGHLDNEITDHVGHIINTLRNVSFVNVARVVRSHDPMTLMDSESPLGHEYDHTFHREPCPTNHTGLHQPEFVLINPTGYRCMPTLYSKNYSIAIYIRSGPEEESMRNTLRRTWIREARRMGMFVVFLIALPIKSETLYKMELESNKTGDMIVLNAFYDAYHNLSLKTRDMFRWHVLNERTDQPTAVMWTNTDGIIFPRNLVEYVRNERVMSRPKVIHGQCTCKNGRCKTNGALPMRDKNAKWYISYDVYPQSHFPHYCMGYSVLFGPNCSQAIAKHAEAKTQKYLMDMWIDDVLFTGIIAVEAGLSWYDAGVFAGAHVESGCGPCVAMHCVGQMNALIRQWALYRSKFSYIPIHVQTHREVKS